MKRQFPKQKMYCQEGRDLPECVFRFRRRGGKVHYKHFCYPTTYVVDRNGNIVGEPIVGAITEKKQAETLQKLIDQALAADMG